MQSPPPQGRGRATGELGRRPAAAGGIAGAEQGRAGREEEGWGGRASGWDQVWRRVRALHSPAPPAGHARLALPDAGGPPCLQGALPPPLSFRGRRGPEVSARVISGAELRVRRRTRQARGLDPQQARPAAPGRARLLCRPRRKVRPPCRARGRRDAVPARLPEDHLRVPATGGCDSGLPGDSGPRAAGAPGRVTRSLPPGLSGPLRPVAACF